jgi:single-stranded DNA-binding protein
VNRVLITGRLTRDPEMRGLASGKNVTTFTVASNEFIGGGKEKAEYHAIVTWDRRPVSRTADASWPRNSGG